MTSGQAKAVVTVSMIWLGVLIVASQNWVALIRDNLKGKATGTPVFTGSVTTQGPGTNLSNRSGGNLALR